LEEKYKDVTQNGYPAFQDLHVMIFLGFAFLMTFLRQAQLSTILYNWIVSVWAMEWAILSVGFWNQVIHGGDEAMTLEKIPISLESMVIGDFGAAAAMITYGCVLGKCNLQQLFFLVFWQMVFYGLNAAIGFNIIGSTDMGGSMFIHAFGAYYGLAATYFFQGKRAEASKNAKSDYNSEVCALIGTLFLWMYYPSFNGALAAGVTQQRVFVNTILAMMGGTMGAMSVSKIMFGKLEMEIMLNAALGGGVGIGTSSDIIQAPFAAMLIGFCGGALSAWAFKKLGPFLQEKINLQDTCGVHSLHGLPGIYGGCVSMVAISLTEGKGFEGFSDKLDAGIGGQVGAQVLGLVMTIGVAIFAGATGGFICSLSCFNPPHALFKDDDHIHEAETRYPKKFFIDTDEKYAQAVVDAAE